MKKLASLLFAAAVCLLWAGSAPSEAGILDELGDSSPACPVSSLGDTVVKLISGALGGNWGDDAANPDTGNIEYIYVIVGKSWVPVESLLTIHCGVNVLLKCAETVDFYGGLKAEGTPENPIEIKAIPEAGGFNFEAAAAEIPALLRYVCFSRDSCPKFALTSKGRILEVINCDIWARSTAICCEDASAMIVGSNIGKIEGGGAAVNFERASGSRIEASAIEIKFSTQAVALTTHGIRMYATQDARIENSLVRIEGQGCVTGVCCDFDCSVLTVSGTFVHAKSENNALPIGIRLVSAGYCDVVNCSLEVVSSSVKQATIWLEGQTSARILDSYLSLGGAGNGQFVSGDGTAQVVVRGCQMQQAIGRAPGCDERALVTTATVGKPFPNPFNTTVSVPLELAQASTTEIVVFDVLGRRVYQSSRGLLPEGRHLLSLKGDSWASGTYFIQLIIDSKPGAPAPVLLIK
ncbi:MAG: T9SS type A sorting domain-containing protein [Calditrichaeota bacterium]|nr:T9SS type A sorting domain-containing protein [Calditrichota bacterium]